MEFEELAMQARWWQTPAARAQTDASLEQLLRELGGAGASGAGTGDASTPDSFASFSPATSFPATSFMVQSCREVTAHLRPQAQPHPSVDPSEPGPGLHLPGRHLVVPETLQALLQQAKAHAQYRKQEQQQWQQAATAAEAIFLNASTIGGPASNLSAPLAHPSSVSCPPRAMTGWDQAPAGAVVGPPSFGAGSTAQLLPLEIAALLRQQAAAAQKRQEQQQQQLLAPTTPNVPVQALPASGQSLDADKTIISVLLESGKVGTCSTKPVAAGQVVLPCEVLHQQQVPHHLQMQLLLQEQHVQQHRPLMPPCRPMDSGVPAWVPNQADQLASLLAHQLRLPLGHLPPPPEEPQEVLVGIQGLYQPYCEQVISNTLNDAATSALATIRHLQAQDAVCGMPVSAKRYFCSLKEVSKVVYNTRCLIVAPDVRVSSTANINPVRALQRILRDAEAGGIPIVFALSRRGIGQVFGRDKSMSIVALMQLEGLETEYQVMVEEAIKGRHLHMQHRSATSRRSPAPVPSSASSFGEPLAPGTTGPARGAYGAAATDIMRRLQANRP